jgi:predicted Zn-dependent protease
MTHQECGVEFTLPAGWKQEEGQQHLMVNPEDGTMVVFFITPGDEGVDAAGDAIEKIITEVVQEPEIEGEGAETNINGMEAFSFNGKGKSDGKDVIFSVDFIKAKKPLIVLALGEQEGVAKHATEVDAIASSLKPIAGSDAPTDAPADEPADEGDKEE